MNIEDLEELCRDICRFIHAHYATLPNRRLLCKTSPSVTFPGVNWQRVTVLTVTLLLLSLCTSSEGVLMSLC